MSLIVARKDSASLLVVSDTHLSFADARAVAVGQKRHPSTGVIKTIIINATTSVSFAGGEAFADDAFQRIGEETTLSEIKAILLEAHLNCCQATDFIIAVGGPPPQIFEVKDSKCLEVETAWIGSKRAYSCFQAFMQGTVESKRSNFFHVEPVAVETQTQQFSTMSKAMDYVIEDDDIPEVDGFRVNTVFTEGHFQYRGYNQSYMSDRPLTIKMPKGVTSFSFPIPHGTAENGGYAINFFRSSNPQYAGIHILQGNFGIIYERENGGLMRPRLVPNMDEVDFIDYAEDNFGIGPSMITQDRRRKCLSAGDDLFQKQDFTGALGWYQKALRKCWGKDRAIFYYRQAVTQANLGQFQQVVRLLEEAVNHDTTYQKHAFALIQEIRRRGRTN